MLVWVMRLWAVLPVGSVRKGSKSVAGGLDDDAALTGAINLLGGLVMLTGTGSYSGLLRAAFFAVPFVLALVLALALPLPPRPFRPFCWRGSMLLG